MRSKSQFTINLNFKFILICFFIIFLLFLIPKSSFPPSLLALSKQVTPAKKPQQSPRNQEPAESSESCLHGGCGKIPASLAYALVHYVTNNVTPQQSLNEISVSMRVLERKSPCNFLVFGLGHDSLMWTALNHGGRTVFLEEDSAWMDETNLRFPFLESYHVVYDTKLTEAEKLLEAGMKEEECKVVGDPRESKCRLSLKGLPDIVYETEWDLIMVDAPTGYHREAPGRMGAIYTAGLIARNRAEGDTDVFVHDVDRDVENKFSMAFLCKGYMIEQEGRIRHFTIPSHRSLHTNTPFCPTTP
ncbi:unnamed protein product [Cuscuta epithymum]|uniref:Polysaccharide biosynthesis domain-containing protein n=1 Tax=Cuscuta epithymum TaxID=186058 RepID=A0AAV0ECM3_9ASTE|nr:unnamed protein product [Cuscuta epithymum]